MIKPLLVIAGATATGKSDISVNIGKIIGGEIISADSMQIYKEMNIGTAKITQEEMDGVKHHLIDIISPNESFNALSFKNHANKAINEIYLRNHIPILTGGTGFYIQAVTKDIDFEEENENDIRKEITDFYNENGMDALFERLKSVDPESSLIIPKQNIKRVIRAVEFYEIHHKKISEHNIEQSMKKSPYNLAYFVITQDRALLYDKIDKRVDTMIEKGLVNEVEELIKKYDHSPSSGLYNAIGYKEIIDYLDGKTNLPRAIELIKQNSRHYAKRQITFFKREKNTIILNKDELSKEEMIERILKEIQNKGIIS